MPSLWRGVLAADASIERLLQDLARLEAQDAPFGNLDRVARLRVAPLTLVLVTKDEISEPGDFYLFAAPKGLFHHFEDKVNEVGCLYFTETANLRVDDLRDISLGHEPLPRVVGNSIEILP